MYYNNCKGGKHDRLIRNDRVINVLYCLYILLMDVILYVSLMYTHYITFYLLKVNYKHTISNIAYSAFK